jgi:hypothetical protein
MVAHNTTIPSFRQALSEIWNSPVTSYPAGEFEVCEWEMQEGDGVAVVGRLFHSGVTLREG